MRLTLLPAGVQTFDIKKIGVRVSLGRKDGCDIIINEPVVSGNHCYITVVSRSIAQIEDASTNGTYINGVKIGKGTKLDARDGDILTLGKPGANTGPIGTGVCVNFKVSFDGLESETAQQVVTSSMVFKQEIEDLRVMVSQGDHRNDALTVKNTEITSKLIVLENELKRVKEDNVGLAVRNDSMRGEVDSLRNRLLVAEQRADIAEKRADTLQGKVVVLERDAAEIVALRAEYKLTTSLRDEMERLRRRNSDLTSQLSVSLETRRRLLSNLESLSQLAGASVRLAEDLVNQGTIPGAVNSDTGSYGTMGNSPTRVMRKPYDGRVVRGMYAENPVEAAMPEEEAPVLDTAPIVSDPIPNVELKGDVEIHNSVLSTGSIIPIQDANVNGVIILGEGLPTQ